MTDTLQTAAQYATAQDLSLRQVQRYLADGRLPGAVKLNGTWSIPADSRPTPLESTDVVPTSYGAQGVLEPFAPLESSTGVPPGLWALEDVAEMLGTSVGGVRRLVDAVPSVGTIGPFGRDGALRLWVAPRT